MCFHPLTNDEVNEIKEGHDNISVRDITVVKSKLKPILVKLINKMFKTGGYPPRYLKDKN